MCLAGMKRFRIVVGSPPLGLALASVTNGRSVLQNRRFKHRRPCRFFERGNRISRAELSWGPAPKRHAMGKNPTISKKFIAAPPRRI
jgi:hypothetical protein